MATLPQLLDVLWNDYSHLNPHAHAIHDLLTARGETLVNDHLAFRTYNDPRINLNVLARAFLNFGYEPRGDYTFPDKHLLARHYEHPTPTYPKIFISHLILEEFSPAFQALVTHLIDQVPPEAPERWDFPLLGRPWIVSYADYEKLRAESEYGAWVAAFGFRANHFTILVNALKTLASLPELNVFLKQHGYKLNDSDGEIKGSPQVYLEQSSTLAGIVPVEFADSTQPIPACYYEFAKRHPLPNGQLFPGFVESSATRIFESTDKRS